MNETATALAQAVQTLDEAARTAKRQEAAARRQARDLRQTIEAIERSCRELGIELVIDTDTDRRSHSHARRDPRA